MRARVRGVPPDRASVPRRPHGSCAAVAPSRRWPVLALQRTAGNRAVASLVVQREWRRVPRRNFDRLPGGLDDADRVFADTEATPPEVVALYANRVRYFLRQHGVWVEQFGGFHADALRGQMPAAQTLPAGAATHVLRGEKAGSSHVGLHTRRHVQDHEVLDTTPPDGSGVYAALVLLDGQTQAKVSLMFPTAWDDHDIIEAIRTAVGALQPGNVLGVRYGAAGDLTIGCRFGGGGTTVDDLHTAFPLYYDDDALDPAGLDALFPNRTQLVQAAVAARENGN